MADETKLRAYLQRIEAELRENILPFWINHTVDRENGGFYGQISNALEIDTQASRGALLSARILWTYSASYRRYQNVAYLSMAEWAYQDLLSRFWDADYGGFYWMVSVDGEPIRDRKQIYGQVFCIYALAEYYAATGTAEALEKAKAVFHLMEMHCHDPKHTGYFEAFSRDWGPVDDMRLSAVDINEMKSMNTHLHIMEGFTNLYRVWPDPTLKTRLAELLNVMMQHIVSSESYHLILFFDEAWTPRSQNVSYGHDIEASWLLVESAEVLGDHALIAQARELAPKMAAAVYNAGLDPDGALVYEEGPHSIEDDTKQWWPQAEAAVGFLNAYQLTGAQRYLEAALRSWDFIDAYLVDQDYGEWIRYVNRDHTRPGEKGEDAAKVSFWKCPYHNGRACMELSERLYALLTE